MAVQPIRRTSLQTLDSAAEFSQMLRYDREALLCFFDSSSSDAWKRMMPAAEKLAEKYNGTTFMEIDINRLGEAARQYNIQRTPAFVVLADGKEAERIEGADEQQLNALLQAHGRVRDVRARRYAGGKQGGSQLREKKFAAQRPEGQQAQRPLGDKVRTMLKKTEAAAKEMLKPKKQMREGRTGDALWHIVMEKPRDDKEFDQLLMSTPDAILVYYGGKINDGADIAFLEDYLGMKYPGATLLKLDESIAKRYNMANVPAFLRMRNGKIEGSIEVADAALLRDVKEQRRVAEQRGAKMFGRRSGYKRNQRFWRRPRAIGRPAQQPCLRYERREGSRNWFMDKLASAKQTIAAALRK